MAAVPRWSRLTEGSTSTRVNGFYSSKAPYLPLSSRHDVVVFQTPPLEQDLLAIGPVEVELWASSTAVDTDFTAKLVDVYPPSDDYPSGYALNIGDGIIRARYRDSREKAEFMTPNEVYRFTVALFPISNVFAKGSPHPAGHFQQQLPSLRRELQYGRAPRPQPAHAIGHQHHQPRQ